MYFDQRTGAPHTICWSKSFFWCKTTFYVVLGNKIKIKSRHFSILWNSIHRLPIILFHSHIDACSLLKSCWERKKAEIGNLNNFLLCDLNLRPRGQRGSISDCSTTPCSSFFYLFHFLFSFRIIFPLFSFFHPLLALLVVLLFLYFFFTFLISLLTSLFSICYFLLWDLQFSKFLVVGL